MTYAYASTYNSAKWGFASLMRVESLSFLSQFKQCSIAGCGRKPFGMHLGRNYCRRHLQQKRNAEDPSAPTKADDPGYCTPGFVYFIGTTVDGGQGPIKIGWSVKPDIRIKEVKTGSPYPVKLLAVWRVSDAPMVEKLLHGRFKPHRLQGEWFGPAPELLALIDLIVAGKYVEAGQLIV